MNLVILPNSLFRENQLAASASAAYIIEHPIFFTEFAFHKQKLILHRCTMKYYADYIRAKYKIVVSYVEFDAAAEIRRILALPNLHCYDPADAAIWREFAGKVTIHDSPLFMESREFAATYEGKMIHNSFYISWRKRHNILIDLAGKPVGGKWSFDKENRQKFPGGYEEKLKIWPKNKYVTEAIEYVERKFGGNFGAANFYLPATFDDIAAYFAEFLAERLECFGPYQDAIAAGIIRGCHSFISPFMNIGMITPREVASAVIKKYEKNRKLLISAEAFLRQLSWREYMRVIYVVKQNWRQENFFGNRGKLPAAWFENPIQKVQFHPINEMIAKLWKWGYLHHIERLMICGNFALINGISPQDIYRWFMMFIDSYNWVMVGNVYGMSQFAFGEYMSRRPYFSSSNYILKMSDFPRGDWTDEWDTTYRKFLKKHAKYFRRNYSTAAIIAKLEY